MSSETTPLPSSWAINHVVGKISSEVKQFLSFREGM